MKAKMAEHHQHREVRIDMTPSDMVGDSLADYTTAARLGRTHSRSASWTFRSPNTADLPSLASLTSVIREFVPAAFTSEDPMSASYTGTPNMDFDSVRTYGHPTVASHTQHSRNASTSNAIPYGDVETGHHRPPIDTQHPIIEELHPPETNESVKWFEENMLLILVLVIRFSWMHRLGKCNWHEYDRSKCRMSECILYSHKNALMHPTPHCTQHTLTGCYALWLVSKHVYVYCSRSCCVTRNVSYLYPWQQISEEGDIIKGMTCVSAQTMSLYVGP